MIVQKVTQEEAYSRYEFSGLLGEGVSGLVYSGVKKSSSEMVAIKTVKFAKSDYDSLVKEINLLFRLRSPYVVSIIEALQFADQMWIVMECCDGGALSDIIRTSQSPLNEAQARDVIAFALFGLQLCHENNIVHRDIKAANILLHHDGAVKLADFGVSADLGAKRQKRNTMIGTAQYMSPEMIKGTSYDEGVDIWSLGITLYELCEGETPYHNKSMKKAFSLISSRASPTFKTPSLWSDDCNDFLRLCLDRNPVARPSASELLRHPWIRPVAESIIKSSLPATATMKLYYQTNISVIRALRTQDDSSDESDNECGFEGLKEEEAARKLAEAESARLEADRKRAEEAILTAQQDDSVKPAPLVEVEVEEDVKRSIEQLQAEEVLEAKMVAERAAAEKAACLIEEEEAKRSAARLQAEQELEDQMTIERASAEKFTRLEEEEEEQEQEKEEAQRLATRLQAEQELDDQMTIERASVGKSTRLAEEGEEEQEKEEIVATTLNVQNMTNQDEYKEDVLHIPDRCEMLAMKQNNRFFKISPWKPAYFVLNEGILMYFRSQKDFAFNTAFGTNSQKQMKKENRFQLSSLSTVREISSPEYTLEVSDPDFDRAVLIKCDNKVSCQQWLRNCKMHINFLKSKSEHECLKGHNRPVDVEVDEDDEEDDEYDDKRDMYKVVKTRVLVNRFVNNLQQAEREQQRASLKRMSNLLALGTDKCPVMRGWVHKRTDHTHHWKKRYIEMEKGCVKYYMTDKNRVPQGTIAFSKESTAHREGGNTILIDGISCFHHSDENATLLSTSLAIRVDDDEWLVDTWFRAILEHIKYCSRIF